MLNVGYQERGDMVIDFEMEVIWSDEAHFRNSCIYLIGTLADSVPRKTRSKYCLEDSRTGFDLNIFCFILGT